MPGFGLTVCGGSDVPHKEGDSGIFVSEVSRPDIDLCVGDRILEVGDIDWYRHKNKKARLAQLGIIE